MATLRDSPLNLSITDLSELANRALKRMADLDPTTRAQYEGLPEGVIAMVVGEVVNEATTQQPGFAMATRLLRAHLHELAHLSQPRRTAHRVPFGAIPLRTRLGFGLPSVLDPFPMHIPDPHLFFWSDGQSFMATHLVPTQEAANAACLADPTIGVIDQTVHGIWLATNHGQTRPDPFSPTAKSHVGFTNAHMRLGVIFAGKVYLVAYIDVRPGDWALSVTARRKADGHAIVGILPDTRCLYAKAHLGRLL